MGGGGGVGLRAASGVAIRGWSGASTRLQAAAGMGVEEGGRIRPVGCGEMAGGGDRPRVRGGCRTEGRGGGDSEQSRGARCLLSLGAGPVGEEDATVVCVTQTDSGPPPPPPATGLFGNPCQPFPVCIPGSQYWGSNTQTHKALPPDVKVGGIRPLQGQSWSPSGGSACPVCGELCSRGTRQNLSQGRTENPC